MEIIENSKRETKVIQEGFLNKKALNQQNSINVTESLICYALVNNCLSSFVLTRQRDFALAIFVRMM